MLGLTGVIAGRFALEGVAGAGGMATVYRARELSTGAPVAVKVLTGSGAADRERFVEEAVLLAALTHPAIVRHVDHGITEDGAAYLAMEWLDGSNLGARLGLGRLSLGEAVTVLRQVSEALAYAHLHGIVHRDIKPENVFLPASALGALKLLDFGIACRAGAQVAAPPVAGHLGEGGMVGTPGYLAPEIVQGGTAIDPRADVFALGCLAFHCLAGRGPFHADSVPAILANVLAGNPPALTALASDVPPALADLIASMIARAPARRPQDARHVVEALDALIASGVLPQVDGSAAGVVSLTENEQRIVGLPALAGPFGGPFVGRARELEILTSAYLGAVTEGTARAVVLVAPPGTGKSRLRQEFLDRIQALGPVELMFAASDPLGTSSPFALLGRCVARAAKFQSDDSLEERRSKLASRIEGAVAPEDRQRLLAFLGELAGSPFSEGGSPSLRAARQSPQLMEDGLRAAWEDWLAAEARLRPVVLVLEDLQWADPGSISFVDSALRRLRNVPLLVLASARPDLEGAFPQLWSGRDTQVVHLGSLASADAAALVQQTLGAEASPEVVEALVARAAGNPFCLEELIRASREGRGDQLPDSVLGLVQARLDGEPPEARRVLRAASLFGETFDADGVIALLQGAGAGDDVDRWLRHLCARELIARAAGAGSSADDEVTFTFTHALIREAAYAMLTPEDRQLGHRLVAAWLEHAAFPDPMVVAEHFRRGDQGTRSVAWYEQAAARALGANDLLAAIERSALALRALAAAPDVLAGARRTIGRLRLVQAEAQLWRGELSAAKEAARDASADLDPGSAVWLRANASGIVASGKQGDLDAVESWVGEATAAMPEPDARNALATALAWASIYLTFGGRYANADELTGMVGDLAGEGGQVDPQLQALLQQALAIRASTQGDLGACLQFLEQARQGFESAGDVRNLCTARANLAFVYAELGDTGRADQMLRDALASAERMGLADVSAIVLHNLGRVVGLCGDLIGAERLEREAVNRLARQGEPRLEGLARIYLAEILVGAQQFDEAAEQAARAVTVLETTPGLCARAWAALALARTAQGRTTEAVQAAQTAFQMLQSLGTVEEGEAEIRLRYAECLEATDQPADARRVIDEARDHLLARAAKIGDASWRDRFLNDVPENARTLRLAAEWGARPQL